MGASETRPTTIPSDVASTIVSSAGVGLIVYDRDFDYVLWNEKMEELTGLHADEVLGRNAFELFPHLEEQGIDELLHRALAGETVRSPDTPYEVPETGREGWVSGRYSPHRDEDGEIVGVVGIVHEITERKRLEEQLLQSQKMEAIGRLAGGIAHDFNNLLTVLMGRTSLLLERLPDDAASREDLEEIGRAAERAAALTSQLLAFSRKQMLQRTALSVNEVVGGLREMLDRLLGEDVELLVTLDPDAASIEGDRGQLSQVLLNLAVNAREAMPRGGRLHVATRDRTLESTEADSHEIEPGRYVELSVADTGVGMTPEIQERVFEPFYTTKEKGCGTGLGLATVYGIVTQSRGAIEIESEIGEGTTIRILLPASDSAAPSGQRREETVLLVEDDEAVRAAARRMLEDRGYRVLEAADGEEALALVEREGEAIDLLLTDVVLPLMNGRELAEEVDDRLPGLPTLFISGYTEDGVVRQGVIRREVDFLQKPFTAEVLSRRVREALDG